MTPSYAARSAEEIERDLEEVEKARIQYAVAILRVQQQQKHSV